MRVCPSCQTPFDANLAACPVCETPVVSNASHDAIATGPGAFAVSGSHARIKVTQNGNHWDQRPTTSFDRKETNVAGWVELTAALITLAGAGVSALTVVEKFATTQLLLTGVVAAAVTVAVGFFAFHFTAARVRGHSTVRIGGWFLGVILKQTEPTRLTWVAPRAQCVWCPQNAPGVMTPQIIDKLEMWVCNKNRRQHRAQFDWTQI